MADTQLIGLWDALTQTSVLVRKNENLGLLAKTFAVSSVFLLVLVIPYMIFSISAPLFMTALSGQSTINTAGTYNFDYNYNQQVPNAVSNESTYTVNSQVVVEEPENWGPYVDNPVNNSAMAVIGLLGTGTLLVFLAVFLVIVMLQVAMYLTVVVKIYRGESIGMKDLVRSGFRRSFSLIGLYLIVSPLIAFGLLFFILPGLYFLVKFVFAPLYMFDEGVGVIESLKKSWHLTDGYFMNLLFKGIGMQFVLLFVVLPVALLFTYNLGQFVNMVIMAVMYLVLFRVYEDLKRIKNTPAVSDTNVPTQSTATTTLTA